MFSPTSRPANFADLDNGYKIKLRASGDRLVYQVDDDEVTVYVPSSRKAETWDSVIERRLNGAVDASSN
uniref:Uncharacterized protein n=1 Tax=Candidatus Kentrum sp. DK TaxID=2126562 RepID=A0A450S8T5_9GAMM|nr:MAG: hypothetical protein BECKDK2373B_GA0170837_102022 [Candidatus Kentron sp. DK]